MRISDWSSDVCSSDLVNKGAVGNPVELFLIGIGIGGFFDFLPRAALLAGTLGLAVGTDRKSVVQGQSVSVRVDLGGRRIIKKKRPEGIMVCAEIQSDINHVCTRNKLNKLKLN